MLSLEWVLKFFQTHFGSGDSTDELVDQLEGLVVMQENDVSVFLGFFPWCVVFSVFFSVERKAKKQAFQMK